MSEPLNPTPPSGITIPETTVIGKPRTYGIAVPRVRFLLEEAMDLLEEEMAYLKETPKEERKESRYVSRLHKVVESFTRVVRADAAILKDQNLDEKTDEELEEYVRAGRLSE